MIKRPVSHILSTTAGLAAALQGYKYTTLHPDCGTLLSLTEVTAYKLARPQPQNKDLKLLQ